MIVIVAGTGSSVWIVVAGAENFDIVLVVVGAVGPGVGIRVVVLVVVIVVVVGAGVGIRVVVIVALVVVVALLVTTVPQSTISHSRPPAEAGPGSTERQ